jgi:hypothetical protein
MDFQSKAVELFTEAMILLLETTGDLVYSYVLRCQFPFPEQIGSTWVNLVALRSRASR